eukprot:sb/3467377/
MLRILLLVLLVAITTCIKDGTTKSGFTVYLSQKQSDTQLTDWFLIKHDSMEITPSSVAIFVLSHDNTWQRTPAVFSHEASNAIYLKKNLIGIEMMPNKSSCDDKYSKEETVFRNKDIKVADQKISLCYLVTVTNGQHSAGQIVPDGCNVKKCWVPVYPVEKQVPEGELMKEDELVKGKQQLQMEESRISKQSNTFQLDIHNFQTSIFFLRAFVCKVIVKQYGNAVDLSSVDLGEQVKLWYQTTSGTWIPLWTMNHQTYNTPKNIYTSLVTIFSVPSNCNVFKCVASVNGHEDHSQAQQC